MVVERTTQIGPHFAGSKPPVRADCGGLATANVLWFDCVWPEGLVRVRRFETRRRREEREVDGGYGRGSAAAIRQRYGHKRLTATNCTSPLLLFVLHPLHPALLAASLRISLWIRSLFAYLRTVWFWSLGLIEIPTTRAPIALLYRHSSHHLDTTWTSAPITLHRRRDGEHSLLTERSAVTGRFTSRPGIPPPGSGGVICEAG